MSLQKDLGEPGPGKEKTKSLRERRIRGDRRKGPAPEKGETDELGDAKRRTASERVFRYGGGERAEKKRYAGSRVRQHQQGENHPQKKTLGGPRVQNYFGTRTKKGSGFEWPQTDHGTFSRRGTKREGKKRSIRRDRPSESRGGKQPRPRGK